MKKVTIEQIEEFMARYEAISEQDLDAMVTSMQQEQPELLAYLAEASEELLEPNEHEFLVNFGVFFWSLMARDKGLITSVNGSLLDELDKANFDLMNRMETLDEDVFWEEMDVVLDEHIQGDILHVIIEELVDSLESNFIREESFLVIFFMLKTLVECLDRTFLND